MSDDEFKNFDREDLILLIECQKERIGELLADRPQGEWKQISPAGVYECTNCLTTNIETSRYCPYCGARMFAKDTNVPNKKGADDEYRG